MDGMTKQLQTELHLDIGLVEGEQRFAPDCLGLRAAFVPATVESHLGEHPLDGSRSRWDSKGVTSNDRKLRKLLKTKN